MIAIRVITHNIHQVLTNRTTIEWREGVTAQIAAGAAGVGRPRDSHPYDLGARPS